MATYAARLAEQQALQTAGLGLIAIAHADKDFTMVKDPDYTQPAPVGGIVEWVDWPGGAARVAYGV